MQVQTSIPDLAACISGIIKSSEKEDFKEDCASILNLPSGELGDMRQAIEAKLLAAFNRQIHPSQTEKASSILKFEDIQNLLDHTPEMGGDDFNSECSKVWNYL